MAVATACKPSPYDLIVPQSNFGRCTGAVHSFTGIVIAKQGLYHKAAIEIYPCKMVVHLVASYCRPTPTVGPNLQTYKDCSISDRPFWVILILFYRRICRPFWPPLIVYGVINVVVLQGGGDCCRSEFYAPCRTNKYPREIPALPWYRSAVPQMIMAGQSPPTHPSSSNCSVTHVLPLLMFSRIQSH